MASDTDQYGALGAGVFAGLGLCPYVNIDTAVDLMTSCFDVLSVCLGAIGTRISKAVRDRASAIRSRLRRRGGGGAGGAGGMRFFTRATSDPTIEPGSEERCGVEQLPPSYEAALAMSAPESRRDCPNDACSTTQDNGSRLYLNESSMTDGGTEPSTYSTGDLKRTDRNVEQDSLPSYSEAVGMMIAI